MFGTLKTLITGANARAEEHVRDAFAIELIDQKIRETEAQLKAAKNTLATLVQRQRAEQMMLSGLRQRAETMTERAAAALAAGREDMARDAAEAIAQMENEAELRRATVDRLEAQATRLRGSVDVGHRRILELKQGAITAKAIRREQDIQRKLNTSYRSQSSADEAQDLINSVVGKEDPFEHSEILREIDQGLNHDTLDDRMAAAGFGPATKSTADDVLARLKSHA
jgi:phage shock protein A